MSARMAWSRRTAQVTKYTSMKSIQGSSTKIRNVTVSAFLVAHGSWKQSFGYKFKTADRTIVISGDTGPTDAIAKACNRCDVLLHEVYSEAGFSASTPKIQKYSAASIRLLLNLPRKRPRPSLALLVLYHQLYYHGEGADDQLLAK